MDFLIQFHSKNVYFYIHYSCSLKVIALSIFQNFWVDTNFYTYEPFKDLLRKGQFNFTSAEH